MPSLPELYAAEDARRSVPATPPFETIVVRARRRRRHRIAAALAAVVVVAAAAVLAPGLVRSDGAARPAAHPSASALPVSPGVYARLRQIALNMAKGDNDAHPTRLEAVAVTDVHAADSAMSQDLISGAADPGYVVEVQGTFVCTLCSTPFGAHAPQGTVAYAVLRAGSFEPEGDGLGTRWVDLNTLGKAFSLAAPATAQPVVVVTVPQPTASVAPATESAGPAAPDPKSLKEAEDRTRAATLNPAKATIALAARTTVGRLRVAGLTIPAQVPDNREMLVVLVNGEPIFPAGVDKDGKRVTQFAIVFSTDGSGLGAQAVYHGAFGLPDLPDGPRVVATVVDASKLATGANLGFIAAPVSARAQAIPVASALAAVAPPSKARPLAALVYIDTVHVTHRLAWVIQLDCVPVAASTPAGYKGPNLFLETEQVVIDATTGKRLVSADF